MANGFREALGFSESGGDYSRTNSEGYFGKYQWGDPRLQDYNQAHGTNYTRKDFLASPELQEEAQAWHEQDVMNYVMDNGLDYYLGKNIAGVEMTPESLIAMAHLGGKKGMKDFILSGGTSNPSDSQGTSLRDYAAKFSGNPSPTDVSAWMGKNGPLSYSEDVAPSRSLDDVMSAFEMIASSGEDYCPAGTYYDPVKKECVSMSAPRTSLRPAPRPELGSAVKNLGIKSLYE